MIKVATVGTSWITHHFAVAVTEIPGIEIAGAYSRSQARAEEAATSMDAPRAWSDFAQMLADPGVDAVYLGSPNSAHYDQALAALTAGKHVVVEKPAVPTVAEFMRLREEAEKRGLVLFEAMRSAYDPGTEVVKQLLPKVGTLRRASIAFEQRSARYDLVLAGKRVNVFDPELAGGALYDLGIYAVSMMIDLFGVPETVVALEVPVQSGVDGAGAALASYRGLVVDLSYSKITAGRSSGEIQGELGTITFGSVAAPRKITVRYLDGRTEEHRLPGTEDNMEYEVGRFVQLVRGASPAEDQRRTLESLRVVEAVRASRGEEVRL